MKTALHILNQISQGLLILVVSVAVGLFAAVRLGYLEPPKAYIVLSGSMEPAIKTGSIVVVMPKKTYSLGDVITFSQGGEVPTTHRLVNISSQNGAVSYTTKGDANNNTDPETVVKNQVVGSVLLQVPYLGFMADYAKKPQGFIFLVIVPATIIVYEELQFLRREIGQQLKKYRRPAALAITPQPVSTPIPVLVHQHNAPALPVFVPPIITPPPPVTPKPAPPRPLDKRFLLFPGIACLVIFMGITGSYFYDQEVSTGNLLGAASDFATPLQSLAPVSLISDTLGEATPPATESATPDATPSPTLGL